MGRAIEKVAEGLLAHMQLSQVQASVLLDESSRPCTLRVYIFDERAAKQAFKISKWRGYRVDIVRGAKVELYGRAAG